MTRRSWWLAALIIVALALAASANSMANGFAYDDNYLIVKDTRTHSLAGWWRAFADTYWPRQWGGDGYRPLSAITLRIQYVLGGAVPMPFHGVNVALHTLTAVAVFRLACAMLPFGAAFIVAAFYAVHPVHVEAIANVVGQSELWVALLVTLAMGLYVHGRLAGPISRLRWVAIGSVYALACFFKEHGIVLPALIVLAEATVVPDRASLRDRLVRMRVPLMALAVVALVYLWARSRVVLGGTVGFVPYLPFQVVRFTATDRILTAIGVAPEWLRLLLWPARLATEYAPQHVEIAQGPSIAQLPGLLVLLGTLGLAVVCWRRSPITCFGIGWLVVTLLPASNFLVPAGFIIAERTLLLPSVGAMIAVGSAIPWLYERVERMKGLQYAGAGALLVLLGLGVARSYTRNRVWKNNDTLLRQGVIDAPTSYRAHRLLGTYHFEHKRNAEGEKHYNRAIQLFPYDPTLLFALAEQYRVAGACQLAIPLYRTAIAQGTGLRKSQYSLAVCLLEVLELAEAKKVALNAYRWGADFPKAREIVRAADAGQDSLDARRARGDTLRSRRVATNGNRK